MSATLGRAAAGRRDDLFLWLLGSSGWFGHAPFAHALAGELDSAGIANDAIEDGIGERRIADDVMPAIDRHLAGEKNRTGVVAVLDDFEQVAGLVRRERLRTPIVEDEKFDPAEGAQQFGVTPVAAREGERGEEPWDTMIENRQVLFAGFVSQGAGEPAFADAT
jgi:hypothetical protein